MLINCTVLVRVCGGGRSGGIASRVRRVHKLALCSVIQPAEPALFRRLLVGRESMLVACLNLTLGPEANAHDHDTGGSGKHPTCALSEIHN